MRGQVETLVHVAEENAEWLRRVADQIRRGEVVIAADDLKQRGRALWKAALAVRVENDCRGIP